MGKERQPKPAPDLTDWAASEPLGANVARLREAKVTWRAISEIATENGHETPWPDGGRLLRAMNEHLGVSKPKKPREPKTHTVTSDGLPPAPKRRGGKSRHETLKDEWEQPWDDDMTDAEILMILAGTTIHWTVSLTGGEFKATVPEKSKHTKMERGKNGRYITFAAMEGPFQSISLSAIDYTTGGLKHVRT
jgi:hypothetical protein